MRKSLYILCTVLVLIVSQNISANVYASGIKISDDTVSTYANAGNTWDQNFSNGGVKIWFIINEPGIGTLSSTVTIKQGASVIRTLNVAAPVKGVNSVIWDGYNNSSVPAPIGNYTFEVSVADPVGHTSFDSLWVSLAYYQGPDPDGQTTYGYRGVASIYDQNYLTFGNLYVARGTTLTLSLNGFYELRADGNFNRKIGTSPVWPASCPTEVKSFGGLVYGLAGYGFTGSGYLKAFNSVTDTYLDSSLLGTTAVRDLAIKSVGNDTIYYSCRSALSGVAPAIIQKTGFRGDTSTFIDMRPYILTGQNGYIKAAVFDDEGNIYIAFGNASASRKKIAKFNSSGSLVYLDSLDGVFALPGTSVFASLAIHRGSNLASASDDKVYALIWAGSNTSPQNGIYSINLSSAGGTQLTTLTGLTNSATAQQLNTDPAGNVIWANGGLQERVISFSPGAGANSYITLNPTGYSIQVDVTVPVELVNFTANVVGRNVELTWLTATETNNAGFEIERSQSGLWEKIGFVKGNGTMLQSKSYSFIDNHINVTGKIKYRLKQIDLDGSFKYSEAIEVLINIPNTIELSQNYPNPFNPETNIKFKVPFDSKVKLEIFSLNGELVSTLLDMETDAGEHNIKFNAANLSSGTYLYRLSVGTNILTKKMILVK